MFGKDKESAGERQMTTLDTTRANVQPEFVVTVGNVHTLPDYSVLLLPRRKTYAITWG